MKILLFLNKLANVLFFPIFVLFSLGKTEERFKYDLKNYWLIK